jgi:plasmid stabilization system protein ParE
MTYRVVIAERAATEIDEAAVWWAHKHSVDEAKHWYAGIRAAIAGLEGFPMRCPIVAERHELPYEVRELHYGLGPKPTHRVLFTVIRTTVLVLTVRHTSRNDVLPNEL